MILTRKVVRFITLLMGYFTTKPLTRAEAATPARRLPQQDRALAEYQAVADHPGHLPQQERNETVAGRYWSPLQRPPRTPAQNRQGVPGRFGRCSRPPRTPAPAARQEQGSAQKITGPFNGHPNTCPTRAKGQGSAGTGPVTTTTRTPAPTGNRKRARQCPVLVPLQRPPSTCPNKETKACPIRCNDHPRTPAPTERNEGVPEDTSPVTTTTRTPAPARTGQCGTDPVQRPPDTCPNRTSRGVAGRSGRYNDHRTPAQQDKGRAVPRVLVTLQRPRAPAPTGRGGAVTGPVTTTTGAC
ncbi:proteoglycan 4-like [Homarus americanus]|uniref:proteoglycan 4-like n=1 Tax=Homarus americanus TaxID=6706 RepID=UPI001C47A5E5|nr:proteoglycan 4-like [Homarus americanus]